LADINAANHLHDDMQTGSSQLSDNRGAAGSVIPGEETWSESAMVLHFDEALRNGFSFRISRFPDRNATWVWCHVIHDGSLYCYVGHLLPCTAERIDADAAHAIYDTPFETPGPQARISRSGPSRDLKGFAFSARIDAFKGEGGVEGPGDTPVRLEGIFKPGHLRSGSPAGRFERTGEIEATVTIGGRRIALSGLAKAHEQTQTRPRFNAPFTYTMLWGRDASLVALRAKDRRYGNFEDGDRDFPIQEFEIAPRSQKRAFAAVLNDGRRIAGIAETVYNYQVPIFSQMWQGRIVRAVVDGHSLVGMINDWRGDEQQFGLP
jgi:hypothetical protein